MNHKHTIWGYANTAIFALIFMLMGCPTPPNDNKESDVSTKLLFPTLNSQDLVLKEKKLTATFKKAIKIADKNKITVYRDTTALTLTTDYTIALNTDTTKVEITLTTAPILNQKYQVKFQSSAVKDTATTQPNNNLDTHIYTVRRIWTQETEFAGWAGRGGHTTVVFNKALWVLGGWDGSNYKNDVWSSADGKQWTEVTNNAGWAGRSGHATVVFNKALWVLGGWDRKKYNNDVWSSSDGKTWTQVAKNTKSNARWSSRDGHTAVVFNNALWVLGGWDRKKYNNDVWSSSDGKTWAKETDAGWTGRGEHTTVMFGSDFWVLGGSDLKIVYNDVWSSADGQAWNREVVSADWGVREEHTTVFFNGKLWVLGGWDKKKYNNDVWSSSDGKTWAKETDAGWTGRYGHTAVFFNDKIWVLGGYDSSYKNDVWSYGLP